MYKKIFIIGVMLIYLAPFVQAETFDESDVLGSWFVYALDVDPILGAYWNYAEIDVIDTTNIEGNITTPDGSTMKLVDGVASIDPNGYLSGEFTLETGVTGTIVDGLQDQSHSIFSYVSIDTQNALGLAIGIKAGGQYQASDMAGEWRFYGIDVDPTLPGLYWITGDAVVDADGIISTGAYSGPDGTAINMTQGQFSVSSNGKIEGSMVFEGDLNVQLVDGAVDESKTLAVFVYANSKGGLGFDVAFRKGGNYLPSDLAGDWTFYNFTVDTANRLAYWVYGDGTIDGDGNLTGSYTGPDGSVFTISNGQASLNSNGELQGSFTVDGVATETIHSGYMDENKSIIVYVGTSDNNQMDLGIGFRTSVIPAEPSGGGGDGGGGGGCFLNSIWD